MLEYKENMSTEQHDAWHEMNDINEWLLANDYKVNKYVLGEYTDTSQAWLDYKVERAIKIARYTELEIILLH